MPAAALDTHTCTSTVSSEQDNDWTESVGLWQVFALQTCATIQVAVKSRREK